MDEPKPPRGLAEWLRDSEHEQEQERASNRVETIIENAKRLLAEKPDECKRMTPVLSREVRAREIVKAAQVERVLPVVSNAKREFVKTKATPVERVTPVIER